MKKLFSLLAIFLLFGSMTASASYYIVGTFSENGWDADNATLMVNNEITYTLSPGDNEFKVLTTLGSWNNELNYNNIDWSRTTATCEEEAEQHHVMVVLSQTSDVHISIVNGMICVTATSVSNPAANNIITYTATDQINIRGSFGANIVNHTFSNGIGTITFDSDVTSIGYEAFSYCTGLTSVTIPNSVTSIGERAFDLCSGLTSIQVESDNTIYDSRNNCNAIIETASNTLIVGFQNTIIPNSVTSIGERAFEGCTGLTSITIPNSVTSIDFAAFYECTGLTSVTIPSSVTSIGESAFKGCTGLPVEAGIRYADTYMVEAVDKTQTTYKIKQGTKWIGTAAFSSCSNLTSITIPNSVTSIGDYAFSGCSGLTSITIPNSVTSIASGAFAHCSGLTSVTIPNSVTSIGHHAFTHCYGLTSIQVESDNTIYDSRNNCNAIIETTSNTLIVGCQNTDIPNSVTSIGDYAFSGCSGLTSITIPNSVTSIGEYAFFYCTGLTSVAIPNSVTSIEEDAFCGCTSLTSVAIPNSVTSIEGGTFYNCSGLTSITIPNSVTSIGEVAFYGCSGLTSVTIPNSVTSIERGTFSYCSSLTSITIPNSVTSIGEVAFDGCTKLRYITCYAPEAPEVFQNTFSNYNVNLNVPCDYLDEYKFHAVWGSFRYIECIDAEESTVTTTTVTPSTTEATFAWPTSATANTYTLTITKDGVVFCTLTFNANGQLLNIAFAPGRDGAVHAPEAELTATGYQFTVTGLESGSTYAYTLDAKDAGNNVVANYTGTFTTTGGEMGVETVNKHVDTVTKVVRDGQVLIQRGDRLYDLRGQEVR